MELMFHLSLLPLTRQLTNISGHLWHKTLMVRFDNLEVTIIITISVTKNFILILNGLVKFQGNRAQRVEYYLLHKFHARKFIVPDKYSAQSKETMTTKRKISTGIESNENDPDDTNVGDAPEEYNRKAKKGSSYSGGLVLEPKKGLYDKYILLLDFNSLYPSIIQVKSISFLPFNPLNLAMLSQENHLSILFRIMSRLSFPCCISGIQHLLYYC